jgi:hypothetical protein
LLCASAAPNVAIHGDFARIQAETPATNASFANSCGSFGAFHATSIHNLWFYCFQFDLFLFWLFLFWIT